MDWIVKIESNFKRAEEEDPIGESRRLKTEYGEMNFTSEETTEG